MGGEMAEISVTKFAMPAGAQPLPPGCMVIEGHTVLS